jgi:glycosyltransferase involved in cell wall biosynthesis
VKVLLVGTGCLPIPPPGWGAVERAIDGLARALRGLGVEVEILHETGKGGRFDEYRFAWKLPKKLKERHWDVLHASTPVVASVLREKGIPFVYTSHSRHWGGTQGLSQKWGFYLEKRACARARRTIALTPEVAQKMLTVHPRPRADQIRVIPNGVDLVRFSAEWDHRHGTQLLGVGAIHPRKRWHLAARAIRDLPTATLTLVGPIQDVAYARSLDDLAGGQHRVALAGEVSEPELIHRYAAADILVHPSGSELLSITVLEAMASSLPIVGTTVLKDEVPNEEAGILVPEELPPTQQVLALQEAIRGLLDSRVRRLTLGEAARRVAEARHGWERVAKDTLAVYEELVPAPAAPASPSPDGPEPRPPP